MKAASFSDATYLIDSWETEQGLPENSATAMVQTPDGYLWFGSFAGLVRFDGVRFTVFNASNTPELPSSGIVNLHLDSLSRLWVSTLDGLIVSEPNRWTVFRKKKEWTGDYVRTFSERSGVICITSFNGKVFCARGDEMRELAEPPGQKGFGYFGYVDRRGDFWVVQDHFFGQWNGNGWQLSDLAGAVTNRFQAAATGRDGSLLVWSAGKLLRIDDEEIRSQIQPKDSSRMHNVWRIDEDSEGTVWLCTSHNGLFGISGNNRVRHYTAANGLTYDSIRFTFEDREANLWVGSSGGGLLRFKRRTFMNYDLEHGLPERVVKAVIEESRTRVLIGTYGRGVARLENNRISAVRQDSGTNFPSYVQCLLRDRDENLWVGTFNHGVRIKAAGASRSVPFPMSGGRNISALFQDSNGTIWIGGSETTSIYKGGQFEPFGKERGPGGVQCFAENPRDHSIWAGTERGLFRYEGGAWTEVATPNGKSIVRTTSLKPEPDGTMWIAAAGRGLLRVRKDSWAFVTDDQCLPTRNITSILEDNFGFWWLGSDRGVVRIEKSNLDTVADGAAKDLTCQLFDRSDGLGTIECTGGYQSTALKDSSGRLYFATVKGMAMVDPALVRLNTNAPPLHFEALSYISRAKKESVLPADGEIHIPPGSQQIEVYTAALCYSGPEKVELEYELRNGDTVVSKALQRQRSIVLGLLPPGEYVLAVTAANNDGIWSGAPGTLRFLVEPFFWQTIWFRILTLGSVLGAACLTVWQLGRNKIRQQMSRLQQQRAIEQERARLGSILEATSDFVAFSNPQGEVLFVNAAGRRMIGLSIEESIQGVRIPDFHPAWATQCVVDKGLPIAKREGIWSGETALRHRDGREIPVSQVIVAHKNADGTLNFLSTIVRDISDRKQAEDKLRKANGRLHKLSAHLIDIQESERRFIAKELHDEIGQSLTAATLSFQNAEAAGQSCSGQRTLKEGITILNEVLGQVRDLSLDLRPSMLDHVGLPAAIRWQVDRIAQRAGFKAEVVSDGYTINYPSGVEIACYRIVQEALTNVARHASARHVCIELRSTDECLDLSIEDDGIGFNANALRDHFRSFGIVGMEERASLLGGQLAIDSAPDCGTVVRVQIPFPKE